MLNVIPDTRLIKMTPVMYTVIAWVFFFFFTISLLLLIIHIFKGYKFKYEYITDSKDAKFMHFFL